MVYRVVSARAELRKGARFRLRRFPVRPDALCVFEISDWLIMGRSYPGWVVRPHGRWIRVNEATVKCLGEVVPIEA
jgi:hypothetical protein